MEVRPNIVALRITQLKLFINSCVVDFVVGVCKFSNVQLIAASPLAAPLEQFLLPTAPGVLGGLLLQGYLHTVQ